MSQLCFSNRTPALALIGSPCLYLHSKHLWVKMGTYACFFFSNTLAPTWSGSLNITNKRQYCFLNMQYHIILGNVFETSQWSSPVFLSPLINIFFYMVDTSSDFWNLSVHLLGYHQMFDLDIQFKTRCSKCHIQMSKPIYSETSPKHRKCLQNFVFHH